MTELKPGQHVLFTYKGKALSPYYLHFLGEEGVLSHIHEHTGDWVVAFSEQDRLFLSPSQLEPLSNE